MTPELQKNLRFLCAEKPSVAQVCRDIGINQQQFSKYLSGRAKPSAHNLRRIAQYFDVDENLMLGSNQQLLRSYRKNATTLAERRKDPLANSFPGDLTKLRPFLGAYQVFFQSPAAAGGVVVNAVFWMKEWNCLQPVDRSVSDVTLQSRRWTRCDGKVSYQGGRIFVVDNERQGENAFSMYILTPPHRQKKQYLFGTMCFLASLPRRTPYSSKVAWKKFDTYKSVRELFGTCGIHSIESLKIDPAIREFLSTGIEDEPALN